MARTKKTSNALNLQRKVLPMTQKALEALEEAANEMDEVVTWVCDEALAMGMNPTQVNWVNAKSFLHSQHRDCLSSELKAKELGYNSVQCALKSLAQIKERPIQGIESLPSEFHSIPTIWRRGRIKTGTNPGFPPMGLRAAQREYKQIISLLLEAWELADDTDKGNMLVQFLTTSAEEYKDSLYDFLYKTDSPLEEQLLSQIRTMEKEEKWQDFREENRKGRK